VEEIFNFLMLKERDFFLSQNEEDLACLANGYSKAKIKSTLDQLQIPLSSDVLKNLLELTLGIDLDG